MATVEAPAPSVAPLELDPPAYYEPAVHDDADELWNEVLFESDEVDDALARTETTPRVTRAQSHRAR